LLERFLGGSMLGDNLSMISDTTIAATQSLGTDLKDKFKINSLLLSSVITILLFFYLGLNSIYYGTNCKTDFQLIAIVPYLLVMCFALVGVNVFSTLVIGTIMAGIIGLYGNHFTVMEFTQKYMKDSQHDRDILLSMLSGGLAMVDKAGGIDYILYKIKDVLKVRSQHKWNWNTCSLTNLAIANNTVSIVITGNDRQRNK
jgi:Na+/H+ antiporter NhaC